MTAEWHHATVLGTAAVAALAVRPDGCYIDATFGRGGHSGLILEQLGPAGRLIVIDRDPEAIAAAGKLKEGETRLEAVQAPFSQLGAIAEAHAAGSEVDGILFDLGVSSPQLDNAERGFSFLRDGPLDMRMDPGQGVSAERWVNSASEGEIAQVLFEFGEERHARRMARHIVQQRALEPIRTTGRLAAILKQANPAWEKDKHPATRAFQAIRIFINHELEELEAGLRQALSVLKTGGRLVVISFHSLEDRLVKRFIARQAKGDDFPRDLPVTAAMLKPRLRRVGSDINVFHVAEVLAGRADESIAGDEQ